MSPAGLTPSSLVSPPARRILSIAAAVLTASLMLAACDDDAAGRGKLNTKITSGPREGATIAGSTVRFAFKATARGARFRCSLDRAPYRACRSPKRYRGLAQRRHTFRVRAVRRRGGSDRTPAVRRFAVATARPTIASVTGCERPFSASSPWNVEVPTDAVVHPDSAAKVATMDPSNAKLTSDPTQYTFPVYYADASTPRVRVSYVDGWLSHVIALGTALVNRRPRDPAQRVTTMPIPPGTIASAGYDAQIIVIDTTTGEEWDASHFTRDATGYRAWNIGRYNIAWSGVPPRDAEGNPYWLRGPGIPYLSGLIRPCEIARGRIDHALAFAYPKTTARFVYPATRSDGQTPDADGMPEGTRLQLDPRIADSTIRERWRCVDACFTIAKALQRYGMYIADTGGRPKIMAEYEGTARWNGVITADTPSPIPLSAFRVVTPPRT